MTIVIVIIMGGVWAFSSYRDLKGRLDLWVLAIAIAGVLVWQARGQPTGNQHHREARGGGGHPGGLELFLQAAHRSRARPN